MDAYALDIFSNFGLLVAGTANVISSVANIMKITIMAEITETTVFIGLRVFSAR